MTFRIGRKFAQHAYPLSAISGGVAPGPTPSAWSQSIWYIDAISGNDNNNGLTPATAIKTLAEFRRRIGSYNQLTPPFNLNAFPESEPIFGPIGANPIDIWLLSDIPLTDVFNLLTVLGPNVCITVHGAATTVRAGTITAVTALDRPTNQAWEITDAGMAGTWTTDLTLRIRIVGGPNDGAIAYVAKDLGAKTARISPFVIAYPPPAEGIMTVVTPAPGDNYVVETLRAFGMGAVDMLTPAIGPPTFLVPSIFFLDCDIANSQNLDVQGGTRGFGVYINCRFSTPAGNVNGAQDMVNCCFSDSALNTNGGSFNYFAGLAVGFVTSGCTLTIRNDLLCQGAAGAQFGGNAVVGVGAMGVFDSNISGVSVGIIGQSQGGGVLTLTPLGHVPGANIYGQGNAFFGVNITGLSQMDLHTSSFGAPTTPSVTGASGDFSLDGALQAFAFDPTGGSGAPIGPIACTWANFDLAQPGGFGGNVHNLATGAEITSTS